MAKGKEKIRIKSKMTDSFNAFFSHSARWISLFYDQDPLILFRKTTNTNYSPTVCNM